MMDKQRTMTVLFADVSDSARLFQRLGDTEASYAVERCLRRMERAVAGYRGHTLKVSGGELLAGFPSAEEACHAAVDMQLRISTLPPVSGLKLTIRIGLHVGKLNAGQETATDETIATVTRIAARARIDQILASSSLIAELPRQTPILHRLLPDLGNIEEGKTSFALAELDWHSHVGLQRKYSVAIDPTPSEMLTDRLCLRYRGNAYLLDDKSPLLTLGRDPTSGLQIVDRKASRSHGRIERRNGTYFYLDSSTNGTYITNGGSGELVVRRREIELKGSGRLCFGASGSDPKADCADFEHL